MNMETAEFKELLNRYRTGNASAEEEALLETWYVDLRKADQVILNEAELDEAQQLIWKQFVAEHQIIPVKRSLWPRIIGVAAAVAAITLGVWLYYTSAPRHPELVSGPPLANDIAPGKNTATIKIGDGEAITLSDKQTGVVIAANGLKYNDGSALQGVNAKAEVLNQVQDDEGIKRLTVTTPRGGTYQVTLPDGTKVWLNAASVLTYTMPLNERGGIRKVQLSGEAYFEVFRNKNQPFVVTTKNLTTTVLGTHFNISAYDDEKLAKATLLEGSVRVAIGSPNSKGGGPDPRQDEVVLKPSQQALVTGGTGIKVKEVDPEMIIAWKNNKFMFESQGIEEIMNMVSRWYNVKVIYEGDIPTDKFGGSVSRFDNISKVLRALEKTKNVRFRLEGQTVYVSK